MALAAAKDLPHLLVDALELTTLVARKDPRRHQRVASRWLLRLLEEDPHATIEEAALAASSLIALTGPGYEEAAQTLRAMAERAKAAASSQQLRTGVKVALDGPLPHLVARAVKEGTSRDGRSWPGFRGCRSGSGLSHLCPH
jgi:hypothetical protein